VQDLRTVAAFKQSLCQCHGLFCRCEVVRGDTISP